MVRPPHPSPQLVQLRQPKLVGAVNQNRVGVGDVDAGFNNGRAQQQVKPLLGKVAHHLFQLPLS